MLFLKYMLLVVGIGMFVVAAAIVANDAWMIVQYRRKTALGAVAIEPQPLRWRASVALAFLAWAPLLIALSIAVIPSGMAGVRVSQTSGTLAGPLSRCARRHAARRACGSLRHTRQTVTTGGTELKIGDVKMTRQAESLKVRS